MLVAMEEMKQQLLEAAAIGDLETVSALTQRKNRFVILRSHRKVDDKETLEQAVCLAEENNHTDVVKCIWGRLCDGKSSLKRNKLIARLGLVKIVDRNTNSPFYYENVLSSLSPCEKKSFIEKAIKKGYSELARSMTLSCWKKHRCFYNQDILNLVLFAFDHKDKKFIRQFKNYGNLNLFCNCRENAFMNDWYGDATPPKCNCPEERDTKRNRWATKALKKEIGKKDPNVNKINFILTKRSSLYNRKPLHIAARYYDGEYCNWLIKNGENINVFDDSGRTPLHWGAEGKNLDSVKHLIENGADIDARDKNEQTPLHLALQTTNRYEKTNLLNSNNKINPIILKLVALLIENGASISARDKNGQTPLALQTTKD